MSQYQNTKVTTEVPSQSNSKDPSAIARSSRDQSADDIQLMTIPFVNNPGQRIVGTGDARYINTLFEKEDTPMSGVEMMYLRKRPGATAVNQPPAGASTGRGFISWKGAIYSVFANKIYKGTTDLGVTLAASTGRVWWTSTPETATTQYLVMSDGTDLYLIESNDTVTQIDENDDAQFPTNNLGPVLFFDDYILLAQSDGEIWNSDVDAPSAWTSTGVLSAGGYGDALEAIARQKEQVIAFGKSSIQMFFNGGGDASPLSRVQQNAFQIGLSSKATLAQSGETIMWVGSAEDHNDANRQVWIMDGLTKIKTVSTSAINRFLAAEGSSISSATAWMERVSGHMVYVLNLSSANRTFVYDVDMDMWQEWQVAGATTKITWNAATSLNGETYIQDVASGRILKFSDSVYQDNSVNFTVTAQSPRYMFGTPYKKFQYALWIDGDSTSSSANLAVSVSDDDYDNFSTARNIDMSLARKRLSQWGSFYERAYRCTFTDNFPLRLKNYIVSLELGTM